MVGNVVLRGVVDTRGAVQQPVILVASRSFGEHFDLSVRSEDTQPIFRLAVSALEAVCSWQFQPAMADGKPVPASEILTVKFNRPGLIDRGPRIESILENPRTGATPP